MWVFNRNREIRQSREGLVTCQVTNNLLCMLIKHYTIITDIKMLFKIIKLLIVITVCVEIVRKKIQ